MEEDKEQQLKDDLKGLTEERKKRGNKRYHIELSPEQGRVLSEVAARMSITLSLLVKLLLQDKYMALRAGKAPVVCLMIDDDKE